MVLQLHPPLPLLTPKGAGYAHFIIDAGQEHHIRWVVFIDDTGESWTFENPDIRLDHNLTFGRPPKEIKWRDYWNKNKQD